MKEFSENKPNIEIADEAVWLKLKEEATIYINIVRTISENGSASCRHILCNLVMNLISLVELDMHKSTKDQKVFYDSVNDNLSYIKRYLKLLEDFPDFAQKELVPGGGFFPELMSKLRASEEFVDAYEARLRKTN
jgi:hypothetical protein